MRKEANCHHLNVARRAKDTPLRNVRELYAMNVSQDTPCTITARGSGRRIMAEAFKWALIFALVLAIL